MKQTHIDPAVPQSALLQIQAAMAVVVEASHHSPSLREQRRLLQAAALLSAAAEILDWPGCEPAQDAA